MFIIRTCVPYVNTFFNNCKIGILLLTEIVAGDIVNPTYLSLSKWNFVYLLKGGYHYDNTGTI